MGKYFLTRQVGCAAHNDFSDHKASANHEFETDIHAQYIGDQKHQQQQYGTYYRGLLHFPFFAF